MPYICYVNAHTKSEALATVHILGNSLSRANDIVQFNSYSGAESMYHIRVRPVTCALCGHPGWGPWHHRGPWVWPIPGVQVPLLGLQLGADPNPVRALSLPAVQTRLSPTLPGPWFTHKQAMAHSCVSESVTVIHHCPLT